MSTESPPKPSKLLIVVSVLGIGMNLYVLSVVFAEILIGLNLGTAIVIFFAGPACFLFALFQFMGTFRRSYFAADKCSLAYYGVSFVPIAFVLGGIAYSVQAIVAQSPPMSTSPPPPITSIILFVATFLGVVFILGAPGRINSLWARKLAAASEPTQPLFSKTFSLRGFILAVVTFVAMTSVVCNHLRYMLPEEAGFPLYAEHVDASDAPFNLPPGATDVSYCRGYHSAVAFEFSIDEAGFRDWVKSGHGMGLKPGHGVRKFQFSGSAPVLNPSVKFRTLTPSTPFEIRTCNALTRHLDGPTFVQIKDGLYASRSIHHEGFDIAYDRSTKRAYYHFRLH